MRSRLSLVILLLCAICVFVECDLERRDIHRIILKGKSKKLKKNRPNKPPIDHHEHLQGSVEYYGFNENEALASNQFNHELMNHHHYYNSRDKGRPINHHHRDNYHQHEDYQEPIINKPTHQHQYNEKFQEPIINKPAHHQYNENFHEPIKNKPTHQHQYNENFHELMKPKHKHNEEFYELMKPKPPSPDNFVINSYPEEMHTYENQGSPSSSYKIPIKTEIPENWSPLENQNFPPHIPQHEEYNPKPAAPKKKKHRKQPTERPHQKTTIEFTTPIKQSSPHPVTDAPKHAKHQNNYQNYFRNNNHYNSTFKTEASNNRPIKSFPPFQPEKLQSPQSSYEVYESFEDSRPPKHKLLHNLAPVAPTVFTQLSHTQKYPSSGSYQQQKYPFRTELPLKYSSGEIRDEYRNKYNGNYGMRTQPGRTTEHFRYN